MLEVAGFFFALDQEVVNIYFHSFPDQILKHEINQMLIGGPYVFEPKRHYSVIVGPLVSDKGGLLLIPGVHVNLIIP